MVFSFMAHCLGRIYVAGLLGTHLLSPLLGGMCTLPLFSCSFHLYGFFFFLKRGTPLNTELLISISRMPLLRNHECTKRPDTDFFFPPTPQLISEKMAGERKALAVE